MDYEKYKEALERAKIWQKHLYEVGNKDYADELNYIFPELKESEDEEIRKALVEMVHDTTGDSLWIDYNVHKEDALAWLEKQGETTDIDPVFSYNNLVTKKQGGIDNCPLEYSANTVMTDSKKSQRMISAEAKEALFDYENANIQQKDFAPKEPKFKVGDWVVRGDITAQILDIQEQYYVGLDVNGKDFTSSRFLNDDKIHLWNIIKDAKDGDVLASKDKEDILIYKSNSVIELLLTSHISFSKKEGFCPRQYSAWDSNEFIPATKEQRDQLEKEMADAGYTFDFEKKELKKIDNEIIIPFGAKDSELQEATYFIPQGYYAKIEGDKVVIKQGEQKPYELSKDGEIDEEHKVGKWFTGLIPCWINAPSTLQPEHSNHGKNVVAIHLKGGGYRCCCVDDKKPRVFDVAENTPFEEGWHNREASAWSEEDESIALGIESLVSCASLLNIAPDRLDKVKDWLKSIKERIGE